MKNLDKIITNILILTWVGLSCSILEAEVVITEFFINSAEETYIPQYIELYNTSSDPIPLEGWSIKTFIKVDDQIETTYSTQFTSTNNFVTINAPLEIKPLAYFLISSQLDGDYIFYNGNSDIEVYFQLYELEANIEGIGVKGGSIILFDNYNTGIDTVEFDENWPLGEESRGHSLRLHSPDLDNSLPENWSLSPETEKSPLLNEGSEILNYGSPREENAFKLNNIQYYVDQSLDTIYVSGETHIVIGDVDSIYTPDNNFGIPIKFPWVGTFDIIEDQSYELIIIKNHLDTFKVSTNSLNAFIYPEDIFIDTLGEGREIADYTWTVELTKTYSDAIDIIYSDQYSFTIDASDYGKYGCVDNGCCTDSIELVDSTLVSEQCPYGRVICPTTITIINDTLRSNHPAECTPGIDCYSALNYHETANINSNTCHYVSLSVPAFVTGDSGAVVIVPVYLYNDSLANINSIEYTLSFDNSSDIVLYNEDESTFDGTILSGLGSENIEYDDGIDSISVNMADISINGAGIITYLVFKLIGSPSEVMGLTFSSPIIIGGKPGNNIPVPVKDGEIVILQPNYKIWGNVVYYSGGDPYEVPNVELSLSQKFNGEIVPDILVDSTNASGYYNFNLLTEGHYSLSFSKDPPNDCNGNYISGTDISRIARHVTGSEPFNADQFIAADVSLDGTVSGQDASLVAQYIVGLVSNFNDDSTHWIFKPANLETLSSVHAELIYENGQYKVDYQPLVFDDENRDIYAYLLGDVNGNYCHDQLSRYNNNQVQFINIAIDYKPIITLPIIISEAIFLEGMDIEIGYDEDIFSPHSITFNTSNIKTERYNSVSNLLSRDGSIKTVTWAIDEPQIVEGIIGEVSFNWNNKNKSGKIWLKDFQVNDEPVVGGISIIGLNDNDVADGVNIINSLVPVQLSLHQNYPNPFNPQTTIKWSMPLSGIVSLEVYNLQGQLVELLFNGQLEAGIHEQIWDATAYPSGIYFYRMTTNKETLQKVMLLLK